MDNNNTFNDDSIKLEENKQPEDEEELEPKEEEFSEEEVTEEETDDEDEDDEEKKPFPFLIIVPIVVALIAVLVISLICLNQCHGKNGDNTSSQNVNKDEILDNKFKAIVKKQLEIGLFEEDQLKDVIAVSYVDNYPTLFNLDIAVKSATKIYYCSFNEAKYSSDINSYNNFASFIKGLNNDTLNSESILSWDNIDNTQNLPSEGHYLVGKNELSNELHFSGYQLVNNEYHVYHKQTIMENINPLEQNLAHQAIKQGETLFDYYQGL